MVGGPVAASDSQWYSPVCHCVLWCCVRCVSQHGRGGPHGLHGSLGAGSQVGAHCHTPHTRDLCTSHQRVPPSRLMSRVAISPIIRTHAHTHRGSSPESAELNLAVWARRFEFDHCYWSCSRADSHYADQVGGGGRGGSVRRGSGTGGECLHVWWWRGSGRGGGAWPEVA